MTKQIKDLTLLLRTVRAEVASLSSTLTPDTESAKDLSNLLDSARGLSDELLSFGVKFNPARFGELGISLGRPDSIAKFFAFSFLSKEKLPLAELRTSIFYGSGVYAIYYRGNSIGAYQPISGTETPIYVGKANPEDPEAETIEAQGRKLWSRLKEHLKSISTAGLDVDAFEFRVATIQSGMQSSVEDFMIRLFRPIWNKEIKICFGIGKHGDSAATRANKRSPWDTMHPGRAWAAATEQDQRSRTEVEDNIRKHFAEYPPIKDRDELLRLLTV
jgi:hypothetical protein